MTKLFARGVIVLALCVSVIMGANEFGMKPCPEGASVCVPTNDGDIRGALSSYDSYVKYQTNLLRDSDGSYKNFKTTPRFGGAGRFFSGDYTVTGNSVLGFQNPSNWGGTLDSTPSFYIKEGDRKGFVINSSVNTLYLPPHLKPEDIEYARVYWSGNIHLNQLPKAANETYVMDIGCPSKGEDYTTVSIQKFIDIMYDKYSKMIKEHCENNYAYMGVDCSLAVDNLDKGSGLYYPDGRDSRGVWLYDIKDTWYLSWGRWKSYRTFCGEGEISDTSGRAEYNLNFNSSIRLKREVVPTTGVSDGAIAASIKPYLNGYREMKLKAPNVGLKTFSSSEDDTFFSYSINNRQRRGSLYFIYGASSDATEFVKNIVESNSGATSINITGGDVKASEGEVSGPNRSSNGTKRWLNGKELNENTRIANFGSWSLIVVYSKKNMDDIDESTANKYYKPKGITIYDGFSTLIADNNRRAISNFNFSGFFTPNEDEFDAKLTTYATSMAGYTNSNTSGFAEFLNKKYNSMQKIYTLLPNGRKTLYLMGNISTIKPGEDHITSLTNTTNLTMGLDTYDIREFMTPKQTSTRLAYGVGNQNGTGEQSFLNMVAFSTDLYKPNLCYNIVIENAAGVSSTTGFTAVSGETLRNRVTFQHDTRKTSEKVMGLKVNAQLSKNIIYNKNTMRIDNSLTNSSFPSSDKLYSMADNQPGLYKKPFVINKVGEIKGGDNLNANYELVPGSKNKQYNNANEKVLDFYIGYGAGELDDANEFGGGELDKGQKVFVEYNTTVGGLYERPKFTYGFSSRVGGELINFDYGSIMERCKDEVDKITVVPINGLKIVNEYYEDKGDDTNLWTQISNDKFKSKIVYDLNSTDITDNFLTSDQSDALKKIREKFKDDKEYNKERDNYLKPIRDKMVEDFKKLGGILEVSLVTLDAFKGDRVANCSKLTMDDKIPFYQKFKQERYKRTYIDAKGDVITDDNAKTNLNNKADDINKIYQFKISDSKIDIDESAIPLARSKYTFVVSYVPSGLEKMLSCQKSCEDSAKKDPSVNIEKCKADCQKTLANSDNTENTINICASDIFAVRPAFFAYDKPDSELISGDYLTVRTAGSDDLDNFVKNNFYPSDKDKNYVLGYNAVIKTNFLKSDEDKEKEVLDENSTRIRPVLADLCEKAQAEPVIFTDTDNKKITLWDENGTKIIADFSKKSNDKKDRINEEIKDYFNSTYAFLTGKDGKSINSKYLNDEKMGFGKISNTFDDKVIYFNIGHAALKLSDDAWTDVDKGKKDCIPNSYENEKKDSGDFKGKVGCNVGTYFDKAKLKGLKDISLDKFTTQDIPLKFRHDRVEVAVNNLKDNINKKFGNYTFFNTGTVGVEDQMGATLDMNITAKMANNGRYKNITPTLYNSNCYARDVNFALDFGFECGSATNTGSRNRCGPAKTTPTLTQDQICAQNLSDSRCYNIAAVLGISTGQKTNLMNELSFYDNNSSKVKNMNLTGMSAITSTTADFNLDSVGTRLNVGTIINQELLKGITTSSRKIPALTATRVGFTNGVNNFPVIINFDKNQMIANNPKIIFAEDFVQNQSMATREQPLSTDTTKDANGLSTTGIIGTTANNLFFPYSDRNATNTFLTPQNGVAHFYYGNVNGQQLMYSGSRNGIDTNVVSMVFCDDQVQNNATPPILVSAGTCTAADSVFTILRNAAFANKSDRPGFFINSLERFTALDIKKDFVEYYTVEKHSDSITINRGELVNNDSGEVVTFRSSRPYADTVRVVTKPWFIFTDNLADNFNKYNINLQDIGTWGGQGGIKSGDQVGAYLDTNESGKKSAKEIRNKTRRINW